MNPTPESEFNPISDFDQVPPSDFDQVPAPEFDKDTRSWAMACHLTSFVAWAGIPFGNIIGPFVVWYIKRETSPLIDYHGKASLNFQITMTLYSIAAIVLCFLLIGFVLLPAVIIVGVVYTIIAATEANQGRFYRYPDWLCLKFIT